MAGQHSTTELHSSPNTIFSWFLSSSGSVFSDCSFFFSALSYYFPIIWNKCSNNQGSVRDALLLFCISFMATMFPQSRAVRWTPDLHIQLPTSQLHWEVFQACKTNSARPTFWISPHITSQSPFHWSIPPTTAKQARTGITLTFPSALPFTFKRVKPHPSPYFLSHHPWLSYRHFLLDYCKCLAGLSIGIFICTSHNVSRVILSYDLHVPHLNWNV
jgi:hypothetical protein